ARCKALFTEATVVSSSSATSAARQRNTSQRMSTARWRGGRCWRAATKASRTVSLARATSAGSPSGTTRRSGTGWIHLSSGSACRLAASGSRGAPLAPLEEVETDVRGDAVQPRAERRAPLEALVAAPGADERLLHRILGLEGRAEHPVAVAGQLGAMALELELDAGRRARSGLPGRCSRLLRLRHEPAS